MFFVWPLFLSPNTASLVYYTLHNVLIFRAKHFVETWININIYWCLYIVCSRLITVCSHLTKVCSRLITACSHLTTVCLHLTTSVLTSHHKCAHISPQVCSHLATLLQSMHKQSMPFIKLNLLKWSRFLLKKVFFTV